MTEQKTILIVDDMELNREILAVILRRQYRIVMAGNGVEAKQVLDKEHGKVALILLDLIMPVMDGFSFLKFIQSEKRYAGIPVIVITSEASEENVLGGVSMGVKDVLVKPFDPYLVSTRVSNLIALSENRQDTVHEKEAQVQKKAEPLTALIVDDMNINRAIIREALVDDYNIMEADNGKQALLIWEKYKNKINVVLLDILMPGMDGFQVMHEAAKLELLNIPVVAITSEDSIKKVEQMKKAGICEVIHKPFNPAVVKNRVNYLVELNRGRTEG